LIASAIVLAALLAAPGAHAARPAKPALEHLVGALGGATDDASGPRYADLRKLDSHLQELAADRLDGRGSSQADRVGLMISPGDRVLVDAYVSGSIGSATAALRKLGMSVNALSDREPERMVEGWLATDAAPKAAGLSEIKAILPVTGTGTNTGGTLSQGDGATTAPPPARLA